MHSKFFDNVKLLDRIAYLISLLSFLILLFCGIYYLVMNWFSIKYIVVDGNNNVTKQQLFMAISNSDINKSIFMVDLGQLRANLLELPWIKDVNIQRRFPQSLLLKINEYSAFARLEDYGLLTRDGEVFYAADDNLNLPIFVVNNMRLPDAIKFYDVVSQVVFKHGLSIKMAKFDGDVVNFNLSDDERIIVCVGDLEHEIKHLDTYWNKLKQLNPQLNMLNLCYNNAIAINVPHKALPNKAN